MTAPTDGHGIYEGIRSDAGSGVWTPRLNQIAAAGFKLVMNYSALSGHASDLIAYINAANTAGLKVIVSLHDPAIWKNNAIAATYPTMYADSGNQSTDNGFTTYVVNQVKGLAGTWGYYVGDEVLNGDHSALANHAGYIHTADPILPRLLIEGAGTTSTSCCSNNNSTQFDCCDVMGDDYYPIGAASTYSLTTAQTAADIQSYCNTHSLQSAMVLQALSRSAYAPNPPVSLAPWPTEAQMLQFRSDAITHMNPRLILWYSYFDVIQLGSPDFAPALQWLYLTNAISGRTGFTLFPEATRRGYRR